MICDFNVGTEKCNITDLRKCDENNTDDVGYMNVQKSHSLLVLLDEFQRRIIYTNVHYM